ncbi:sensor histidine kinase [Paenibacillus sp. HJGM_3]|uniref:sensor histidine kinase n=1 Tax=Paenibacillus sp. HJGM_3 TaxID=3379816 RepID=UPI00385D6D7C
MSDREFLEILQSNKKIIISSWYERLVLHFPGFHNHEHLMQESYTYFDYLLELNTPLEEHPLQAGISLVCEQLIKRDVSVAHIVHSNQLMVDSILYFVAEHPLGKEIPLRLIRKITHRVFEYERAVLDEYHAILINRLQKNEQTITALHESRLTIIGKMAASMAHEIRNPLTTILGFLKLLRNAVINNQASKLISYLETIESEFNNIQLQITGFLSFSKKDLIEEPFEQISSNTLIKSVIALITPRLINDRIDFQYIEGTDIPLHIQKIALQQVLSNIINNSIDALSEVEKDKKIIVASRLAEDQYIISVTNNGPEIQEEIKDSLFEPFVSSKRDGTGLGLAICKQIMVKNSGDVTFTSSASETTFFIKFTIEKESIALPS